MTSTVFILGASDKPDRYSYKAWKMLNEYGHKTVLISPRVKSIEGESVYPDLKSAHSAHGSPDSLTMYVGSQLSTKLQDEIIFINPKRVIFNPGSENDELASTLKSKGSKVLEACTLVMLRTEQF